MPYSYSLTASEAIDLALKMINITSIEDASQGKDYKYALKILNLMFKAWSSNPKLWKRKQGAIFCSYGQNSYQLGSVSGSDNCSLVTDYITTTLTTASSSNTIILDSVTNININDKIGIELDDTSSARFWTTVSNVNSGTSTITLTDILPSQASIGNTVINYTNKINRPMEVLRASLFDLSSEVETPIKKLSYDKYFNLPIKNQPGRPINYYYDRLLNNSLPYSGTLFVYLTPDNNKYIIRFSYKDLITDVVNPTDILDIPQEWYLATILNLAVYLDKFGYGKLIEAQATQQDAMLELSKVEADNSDDEYLEIQINSSDET